MTDSIANWLNEIIPFSGEWTAFIVSLFPILELRGGMIIAALRQVPYGLALPICVVANLLPIPFVLWLIHPFFNWLKTTKHLKKVADWLERKTEKNKDKVLKYEFFGLLLFVAIPLPGTGAWTGSLVAAMLDMPIKKSFLSIVLGVLGAAAIMSVVTYVIPWAVALLAA